MEILIAVAILGGLGLAFGLVLAAASKVFYVETDPRLDALNECLPGANCGGCGYAGCGAYAEAVLNGEAPIGACASGGNECAQAMSAIMGVKAEIVARKVALVKCSGQKTYNEVGEQIGGAKVKGIYEGFKDCLSASKVGGHGPLACKYGCLGYGSCVKVCKYDAIKVIDGVAKVDVDKCVGCGIVIGILVFLACQVYQFRLIVKSMSKSGPMLSAVLCASTNVIGLYTTFAVAALAVAWSWWALLYLLALVVLPVFFSAMRFPLPAV